MIHVDSLVLKHFNTKWLLIVPSICGELFIIFVLGCCVTLQHNICTHSGYFCVFRNKLDFHVFPLTAKMLFNGCPPLLNVCNNNNPSSLFSCTKSPAVDHLPDKETRKRKPKKTFEIDFNEDVNFDTYFRTTRVGTLFASVKTQYIRVSSGIHIVWHLLLSIKGATYGKICYLARRFIPLLSVQ